MNAMSHQPLSRVAQTSQSLQTKGSHTSVHDKYLSSIYCLLLCARLQAVEPLHIRPGM